MKLKGVYFIVSLRWMLLSITLKMIQEHLSTMTEKVKPLTRIVYFHFKKFLKSLTLYFVIRRKANPYNKMFTRSSSL